MIAHASQFRCSARPNVIAQVRYESPGDLLPWADPYIASLFGFADPQSEIDTWVIDDADGDEVSLRW
jgi:hypothetical protein